MGTKSFTIGWSGKILAVLALALFGGSALFAGLSEKQADAAGLPSGYSESYTIKTVLSSSFSTSIAHSSSGDVLTVTHYPSDGDGNCTNDGASVYVDGSLANMSYATASTWTCTGTYNIGKSLYVESGQWMNISELQGDINMSTYGSSSNMTTSWGPYSSVSGSQTFEVKVSSSYTAASDADSDGVADTSDNCSQTSNANQADADSDGIGDACDTYTCTSSTSSTGLSCSTCTGTDGKKSSYSCWSSSTSTTSSGSSYTSKYYVDSDGLYCSEWKDSTGKTTSVSCWKNTSTTTSGYEKYVKGVSCTSSTKSNGSWCEDCTVTSTGVAYTDSYTGTNSCSSTSTSTTTTTTTDTGSTCTTGSTDSATGLQCSTCKNSAGTTSSYSCWSNTSTTTGSSYTNKYYKNSDGLYCSETVSGGKTTYISCWQNTSTSTSGYEKYIKGVTCTSGTKSNGSWCEDCTVTSTGAVYSDPYITTASNSCGSTTTTTTTTTTTPTTTTTTNGTTTTTTNGTACSTWVDANGTCMGYDTWGTSAEDEDKTCVLYTGSTEPYCYTNTYSTCTNSTSGDLECSTCTSKKGKVTSKSCWVPWTGTSSTTDNSSSVCEYSIDSDGLYCSECYSSSGKLTNSSCWLDTSTASVTGTGYDSSWKDKYKLGATCEWFETQANTSSSNYYGAGTYSSWCEVCTTANGTVLDDYNSCGNDWDYADDDDDNLTDDIWETDEQCTKWDSRGNCTSYAQPTCSSWDDSCKEGEKDDHWSKIGRASCRERV